MILRGGSGKSGYPPTVLPILGMAFNDIIPLLMALEKCVASIEM
jgi:hypothetical protein